MKISIFILFFLISTSISLLIPGIGNIIGQKNEYFDSYLKVPYAYPPLGSLRFKSPKSPYIWEGTYNSKEYPSICPQNDSPDSDYIWYSNRTMSEDCLFLSIWKPKKIDPNGNPVLVFIHGGSFKEGGASQWILNGEHMAKKESIIFVLVQYRLGILGFLGIDELKQESDEKITGNYGILDQISALKWIKNNIKAFGGNPNKITLAGESAGGSSVSLHLVMSQSKGLFNQAVIFSTATFIELFNEEKLFNQSKSSLINICNNTRFESLLNCIRNISVKDILTLPFKDSNPVIDGVYIKEHTYKSFKNWQNLNNVNSILIGNVKNEGTMFLPQDIIPLNQYKNIIYEYCSWNISNKTIEKIKNKYICNENNCFNQLSEIVGDSWFICPAILVSKSISETNKNKIYSYVFSQITQSLKNIFPLYKVSHGSEIPYFFYNVNYEFFNFTYEEKKLAKVMSHNLAEFVKEKNSDFILFDKNNEFARINFTVTNDDKYYNIIKNWKNNICDNVWLETYENAYDYNEKKEVYGFFQKI